MARIAAILMLFTLLSGFAAATARAEDVDVALVLVTDVSRSIDDSEFKLEKDGYSTAFNNPRVQEAIRGGPLGRIAVAYLEFASNFEVRTVVDWTIISDDRSARTFTDRLAAEPRSFWGRTSISAGIDQAMQLFAEAGVESTRHVIDVCGDGTNNAGREVSDARDDALKAGVTINGLTIINDHPVSWTFAHVQPPGGLANYYRDNVSGGPGSFVLEIHDFATFGDAMTRKLVNEIAALPDKTYLARSR
jgi:hypothetical protein